ncbi:MAG: hypothetical protein ACPG3T_05705, partial [Pseudomonadales bacterium]
MTKKITMIRELLLISTALLTHSLNSYAGEFNYNAELTLLTDSAVTIEAANIGTNNDANSDSATGQLLSTEYQFDNRLLVGYEFYNESYQDLSENDTQYHSINASYDNNIGNFDFLLNTSHLDMKLDGE